MPSKIASPTAATFLTLALLLVAGTGADSALAQASPGSEATTPPEKAKDLSKATQNPVGDLTAIPFQFNFTSGGPLEDRTFYNLNFQPVVPLRLSEDWNLIARTIVPFLSIPVAGPTPGLEPRSTGIGDIQQQLFVTPVEAGGVIWGVGPVFSFPTATNELARTGDWAVGPTAVVLAMPGPWVVGALANQLWTVGGDDIGEDVDQLLVQPFVNYNLARGWALSSAPVITKNNAITTGEQWTVPVGAGVTKITAIGTRPVSLGLFYFHNAVRPEGTGEDTVRMVFNLLYPIAKH